MPFKSERQEAYLRINKPEVAEEYENHGGAYPAPANFNPGGGDALIQGNTRAPYGDEYAVDGMDGMNPFREGGVPDVPSPDDDSLIY